MRAVLTASSSRPNNSFKMEVLNAHTSVRCGWKVYLDPSCRVLIMDDSRTRWIPIRFLEHNKWGSIWKGQDISACHLVDIVEEGEPQESLPIVKEFIADAATKIGFSFLGKVDKVQLFYRWPLVPRRSDYECDAFTI